MCETLIESIVRSGFRSDGNSEQVAPSDSTETQNLAFRFPLHVDRYEDTPSTIVSIPVPGEIDLEVHGHCAVARYDGVILAELELEGPAVSGLNLRTDNDGLQILVVRGQPGATRILVRTDDFRVVDRGVWDTASGWKSFAGDRDLWHLLEPAKTSSGMNRLFVVFSAIGDPYDFTYNYKSSISDVDSNRLYILDDFGARGSYYWLDHRDETIFHSVQAFILEFVRELDLSMTDVIFVGSSKGGTAAILHGVSLGVKEVWAGAPQYRVGDYLFGTDTSILNFMSGGSSVVERDWLNNRMQLALMEGETKTKIRVAVGSKDHHLPNHVQPLIVDTTRFGYESELIEVAGFPHAKIGELFGHYLTAKSHQLSSASLEDVLPHAFRWMSNDIQFMCWGALDQTLCVDMYCEDGAINRLPYTNDNEFIFAVPEKRQPVRFRVYKKSTKNSEITAFTTRWFFPQRKGRIVN